jgi:hypothetical protein
VPTRCAFKERCTWISKTINCPIFNNNAPDAASFTGNSRHGVEMARGM